MIPLAPDSDLPHRDRLLDPRAMSERLRTLLPLPGAERARCTRLRAKYRVGESLRVVHRLEIDGRSAWIGLRGFPAGCSRAAFERAREQAKPIAGNPGVIHDPETESILFLFPADRKLQELPSLLQPDAIRRHTGIASRRSQLVAWAPEKGAVLRLDGDAGEPVGYVKVYARGGADAAASTLRHARRASMAALGSPDLPDVLAVSEPLLVLAPAPGRPLASLVGFERDVALRALGCALARLHAVPPPTRVGHFCRFDAARIESAARILSRARPDTAHAAWALCASLVLNRPRATAAPALLHGDLHLKNALWDGSRLTLLDLDQAAAGPAAADLGGFLAATLVANPCRANPGSAAFFEGYASAGAPPGATELAWHTAAALLVERALRAVHRVRVPMLKRLPELLSLARDQLEVNHA